MNSFARILSFINPFLFYYTALFIIGKVYEVTTGNESIWQPMWNKFMDLFGDNEVVHVVFVLNIYTFSIFWIFGLALMFMQKLKVPKSFEGFKIQAIDNDVKGERLLQVRNKIRLK